MDKIVGERFIGRGSDEGDWEFSPDGVDFKMCFGHAVAVSGKRLGIPDRSWRKSFELEIQNWQLPTHRRY